jgi:hypothetical protein
MWWLVVALAVIAQWCGVEALRWRAMYNRLKRKIASEEGEPKCLTKCS